MPVTCLVLNCGSRSNRDDVHFYSVPITLNHRFLTHKNELSERRRAQWIAAIKRSDLTEKKLKNQKICGKHFITGKPAALEDEYDPDWVPSQNMGYDWHGFQNIHAKREHDVEIINIRSKKRQKLILEHTEYDIINRRETEDLELDTGISSQT